MKKIGLFLMFFSFYVWASEEATPKELDDEEIANLLLDAFETEIARLKLLLESTRVCSFEVYEYRESLYRKLNHTRFWYDDFREHHKDYITLSMEDREGFREIAQEWADGKLHTK